MISNNPFCSQTGRIVWEKENPNGCELMDDKLQEEDDEDDDQEKRLIFLVRHDPRKCSFVQITRNIERHGGSMAIIIDEKEKSDITKVTMSDDGTGQGIRIPAVLINKEDGERIIDWIIHASPAG